MVFSFLRSRKAFLRFRPFHIDKRGQASNCPQTSSDILSKRVGVVPYITRCAPLHLRVYSTNEAGLINIFVSCVIVCYGLRCLPDLPGRTSRLQVNTR